MLSKELEDLWRSARARNRGSELSRKIEDRLVHQDITGSQRQFIAYINSPDMQTLRQYFEGHLPESTEVVKT